MALLSNHNFWLIADLIPLINSMPKLDISQSFYFKYKLDIHDNTAYKIIYKCAHNVVLGDIY